jgi:hypothetical protein
MPSPDTSMISEHYIHVPFPVLTADGDGNAISPPIPVPAPGSVTVVKFNVKTFSPCDNKMHTAKVKVAPIRIPSSVFLIDLSFGDLVDPGNIDSAASGSVDIRFRDCYKCVRPIDSGCPDPMGPLALSRSVTGTLFSVDLTISEYEPGAEVNILGALVVSLP